MLQVSEQAAQRCAGAGLRRGTSEFASCSIQAQSNIEQEIERTERGGPQTARYQSDSGDLQRAIEMARADAERERRERQNLRMIELGLGMAAGANRPPPPSNDGIRTYNVNGRMFTCTTSGTFTNCF